MPEGVEWTKPEGVRFIWLTTRKDADVVLREAVRRDVARNQMKLNFTLESTGRIYEGVLIFTFLLS
ncbi:hypothetical protein [Thermococcus sp.]